MAMYMEFLRLFVVSAEGKVIMCETDDQWDFPWFVYDYPHPNNLVCALGELGKKLGVEATDPLFTGVAELLGDLYSKRQPGIEGDSFRLAMSHMVWIEPHGTIPDLPGKWEWKDMSFLETCSAAEAYDDRFEVIIARAIRFLREGLPEMRERWQPRHRLGWHGKASAWLKEVMERHGETVAGPVTQVQKKLTSTVLKARSNKGTHYFLKAPTAGSAEIDITKAVYEVMPEWRLELIDISRPLGSFVSAEFETVYGRVKESGKEAVSRTIVKALGEMQLSSIAHTACLVEKGCPLLGLPELMKGVDEVDSFLIGDIRELAPQLQAMSNRLEEYNVPLTLTHGDFSRRNVGFIKDEDGNEKERTILFDWQYTAVSHPFFDFHEYCTELSDEVRDEYLGMWGEYESLERCREAFEIGTAMGWLLKAFVAGRCKRVGTPDQESEMTEWVRWCWNFVRVRTHELSKSLGKPVAGEEGEVVKLGEVEADGSDIGNINV